MADELTDTGIRAAIRDAKKTADPRATRRLSDGRGLHLHINAQGGAWWRFRYRHEGVAKMISLGVYPEINLKLARERLDEARRLLNKGVDPSARRKAERAAHSDTLGAVAEAFFLKHEKSVAPSTFKRDQYTFAKLLPYLGNRPISSITAPDLLEALEKLKDKPGKGRWRDGLDSAHRARQLFSRIACYAVTLDKAKYDVSAALKGALPAHTPESYAALTDPAKIGGLLVALDGYQGQATTATALRLLPYVFTRPGELRGMRWQELEEIDGKQPLWRIPPRASDGTRRMKMDEPHLVPLPRQAVALLQAIRPFTCDGLLVFPGLRGLDRPISNNTLTAALRTLGYSGEEQTAHGFRSIASTLLNERGYAPDLIELQLAHKDQSVRAIYNRSVRLSDRRKMLQEWADYLDGLKAAASPSE